MDDEYSELRELEDDEYKSYTVNNLIIGFGECGVKCVKSCFVIFNAFFFVLGISIFIMGLWLNAIRENTSVSVADASGIYDKISGPNFLIIIGVVTLSLTLIACFGTRKNNICIISFYLLLLLMILAFECAAILFTYVYREKVENSLIDGLKETLDKYGQVGNEIITKSIDSLQSGFHCCGNQGYFDWAKTKWGKIKNNSLPISCCIINHVTVCNSNVTLNSDNIFKSGCYIHIRKYVLENVHIINGFGIWIAMVEILGILFSIIMIARIKRERKLNESSEEQIYELQHDRSYYKND